MYITHVQNSTQRELINIEDICETAPTVFIDSPYPRRLQSPTICKWNYKGSMFSSVIINPAEVRARDLPHDEVHVGTLRGAPAL